MDKNAFDQLAKAVTSRPGSRRLLAQVLAASSFGVVLDRFGLSTTIEAKPKGNGKGKDRERQKADRREHRAGALRAQARRGGNGKKKRRQDKPSPPPPLPPGCQSCNDCQMCQDGACVADAALEGVGCLASGNRCGNCRAGQCTASSEPACGDGSCRGRTGCCADEKACPFSESPTGYACVGLNDCCPGQKRCASGACIAGNRCCPEEWQCQDGSCRAQNQCCNNETRCQDGSCVSNGACCGDEPEPDCDECSHVSCVGGRKTCVSACQDDENCCTGVCVGSCFNGCQRYGGCSSCSKPPTGTAYCEAQNRCVSTSCPSGQQYDPGTCQCTSECELNCDSDGVCQTLGCEGLEACVNGRCKQACLNPAPGDLPGIPCIGYDSRGFVVGCCPNGMVCGKVWGSLSCCAAPACPATPS